jgi:hypothetical protein
VRIRTGAVFRVTLLLVSNVLNEEKKQQAIALEWSLRQIQKAIGVRRETISVYLRPAGIAMRVPRGQYIPAKPASPDQLVPSADGCQKFTSSTSATNVATSFFPEALVHPPHSLSSMITALATFERS